MRGPAFRAALLAALCGCDRQPVARAPVAAPRCPPDVVARTPPIHAVFPQGWARVRLLPCPGASAISGPTILEVEGADGAAMGWAPGRQGGETLGVLTAVPGRDGPRRFGAPPGAARVVVLGPWAGPGPAPVVTRLTLVRRGAPDPPP